MNLNVEMQNTQIRIFKGWLAATLLAFVLPPVGDLAGNANNIFLVFKGRWRWIGQDFNYDFIYFPMLVLELFLIAVAALSFARIHKGYNK